MINSKYIQVGKWVLTEKLTYGRFGLPKLVTDISKSRVYWKAPHRSKGVIEEWTTGYCSISSVLRVVDSEEIGVAAWHEQIRLSQILEAETGSAQKRFQENMNNFFNTQ